MKVLKFSPHLVPLILSGEKKSTWRLFDDKDLHVGDQLSLVNKATGEEFAQAHIIAVQQKHLGNITHEDEVQESHEPFRDAADRLATYREYYGDKVTNDTVVKMVRFALLS